MPSCECKVCRADAKHPLAEAHRRLATILAYVDPADRLDVVGQMATTDVIPEADLAAMVGITPAEVATWRATAANRDAQQMVDRFTMLERILVETPGTTPAALIAEFRQCMQTRLAPAPGEPYRVSINVFDRRLDLLIPRTLVGIWIFTEIFLDKDYQHTATPVSRVYDVGANVGFAALYLHAMYPSTELVCVEPVEENLALLRANLEANNVKATVLPIALGPTASKLSIWVYPDFMGANGLVRREWVVDSTAKAAKRREIERVIDVVPFGDVITGRDIGLKIDIEGPEHGLVTAPEVIANSTWIAGEIHYGESFSPLDKATALESMIRKTHDMQVLPPVYRGFSNVSKNFVAMRRS